MVCHSEPGLPDAAIPLIFQLDGHVAIPAGSWPVLTEGQQLPSRVSRYRLSR